MDRSSSREDCYKVIHCRDLVESVYVVTALDSRQARSLVKDQLLDDHRCDIGCRWSVSLFRPSPTYFLYAINRATGEMSPPSVTSERSMCFVCLGNVAPST